jgi:hypothetical protein
MHLSIVSFSIQYSVPFASVVMYRIFHQSGYHKNSTLTYTKCLIELRSAASQHFHDTCLQSPLQ